MPTVLPAFGAETAARMWVTANGALGQLWRETAAGRTPITAPEGHCDQALLQGERS